MGRDEDDKEGGTVLPPGKARRGALTAVLLLVKKGNRHVDLHIAMPRTPVHPTLPPITFGATEATIMTTDIRFCRRKDFTRNLVRHNDQCRKWRAAVGLTRIAAIACQIANGILFTRTVAPPLPQIEGCMDMAI